MKTVSQPTEAAVSNFHSRKTIAMSQNSTPTTSTIGNGRLPSEDELREIVVSLRGLRFGSVNIVVQDGVIIQIDRTEKKRLRMRREPDNGQA
jgi:hypothetical protein